MTRVQPIPVLATDGFHVRRLVLGGILGVIGAAGIAPSPTVAASSRRFSGKASEAVWSTLTELPTLNVGSGTPIYMLVAPHCPYSQQLYRDCRAPRAGFQARLIAMPSDDIDIVRYAELLTHPTVNLFDRLMANYRRPAGVSLDTAWAKLSGEAQTTVSNVVLLIDALSQAQARIGVAPGTPSLYWPGSSGIVTMNGYSSSTINAIINP